jgi:indoleamine 2,3-dioxygenase
MNGFRIEDFDVTAKRGFLTRFDMCGTKLPDEFRPIEDMGANLSRFLTTGRIRGFLDRLSEVDIAKHLDKLSPQQLQLLMVRYSFIVQAYVWGEEHAPDHLPRNLAVPYCKLADKLGEFPLLPYASYTLNNWFRLDKEKGVELDNIAVIQNFYGGVDENWFILVHVGIEAKAGPALAAIPALLSAADAKDMASVRKQLQMITESWEKIQPVFARMVEKCDPYMYYNRVRPYIHGWKGNPALPDGLVYEGVEKFGGKGQKFCGQTGSQSSLVPTMDALLGIAHESDPLRQFLDELHQYRPVKHRKFIEEVHKRSHLREFVKSSNDAELVGLYNEIVAHVHKFRGQHLEYAANYINKQARGADGNPVDVGTGGTPFMKYLKKHRDESERHLLPAPEKKKG